jgi:hypothetical protein
MQNLTFRCSVLLVTLVVGTSIPALSNFGTTHRSNQITEPDVCSWCQPELLKQVVKAVDKPDLSIVVRVNSNPSLFTVRPIKLSDPGPTVIDLDLGEDIDGQEVKLAGGSSTDRYRIFQRYRTTMTVMAEGPHLDLTDWHHFDSTWVPLQSLDGNRFRTLAGDQMDASRFPRVTRSEIIQAVRARAGDWPDVLQLAKSCRGPNDAPCAVMISSIYLRIEKQVQGRWTNADVVEIRIPMGC